MPSWPAARELVAEREMTAGRAAPAPASDAAPAGYDWANAGATLGITAVLPAVASVILLASDVRLATDNIILTLVAAFAWTIWFAVGAGSAWRAWCGMVSSSTLTIRGDEIAGRGVWPVRRWRSVRVDKLERTRYCMTSGSDGTVHQSPVH